jgi:hypothetical protein
LRFCDLRFALVSFRTRRFAAMHMAFCLSRNDTVCAHRADADQRTAGRSIFVRQSLSVVIQAPRDHLGTESADATSAPELKVAMQMSRRRTRSKASIKVFTVTESRYFAFQERLSVYLANFLILHWKVNFCQ